MVYLRTLSLYCEMNGTDPKALLKVAKTKKFRDGFIDFVRSLEREGKAGSYIVRFKKVLRSWLAFNGLDLVEIKVAKEKELGRELSKEEEIQLFEEQLRKIRENPDPQKIVREEELEKYLADGWQFISVLPSKRILIRKELALGRHQQNGGPLKSSFPHYSKHSFTICMSEWNPLSYIKHSGKVLMV